MRGGMFHNRIVEEAEMIFRSNGWKVHTEYRYIHNDVTTYFDLFAVKKAYKIACEVETTPRHGIDNIRKALLTGIPLWVIVPSRTIHLQLNQKLISSNLNTNPHTLRIMLLYQLEAELIHFQKNNLS